MIFSFLDQYADLVQQFIVAHIVLAPLFLLLIDELGVPLLVPGDAVLAYVGYQLAVRHTATLWEAFFVAITVILTGSTILFWLSKRYGDGLLRGVSRYMNVKEHQLKRAEGMFRKYGVWAIIVGRHVTGIRIPLTVFATSSGMSYPVFIISTAISTAGWVFFYLAIGNRYGKDLNRAIHSDAILTGIIAAVAFMLVIGFHLFRRRRASRSSVD
jgi:membrane-associated protein